MVKTLLAKKVTITLEAPNRSICRTNDTFQRESPYLGIRGKRGIRGNGANRCQPKADRPLGETGPSLRLRSG